MIKIKSGVYGFKDEHGAIQPKTSKSEAFSLSAEEERRLVNRGIAEYETEKPVATPQEDENGGGAGDPPAGDESGGGGDDKPDYSIDTNGNVLRKLMKAAGLTIEADMSKADMVSALDAYYGDEEDDESPPQLGAAEPVK